jgi:hypothetical protein
LEKRFLESGKTLSINQLMKEESKNQLNDQIFQLDRSKNNQYKFVMLKMNDIIDDESDSKKTLIQLIDMSDKILYTE